MPSAGPDLTAPQAAAAAHRHGPLLIVAGAGSGKTRTLVHRVADLLAGGVPPERLLLLTFTRRAAQEMLDRTAALVGMDARRVQGGTFHGTANRLLRRFGPAAGLPSDFTILDQGDAADLMARARAGVVAEGKDGRRDGTTAGSREGGSTGGGSREAGGRAVAVSRGGGGGDGRARGVRFPRAETCLALHSQRVNTGADIADCLADRYPHFLEYAGDLETVFAEYARRKADANVLDYDDLLLAFALLLEHGGAVADRVRAEYEHVLVDEYQDTNPLQARILRALCPAGTLTVVGDDAQSIYAFRGATVRNILDFPREFPGTRILTLEQNFRSTQSILATSNAVISRARERYSKELWSDRPVGDLPWLVVTRDEREQTMFIVERLLELHEEGIPLREMAVLVRAGYLSAELEIELANRRIPFEKWGGLKFLEAAHIKDVLAFLRVLENPRDEVSWFRLLRLLPGVGDTTAARAVDALAAAGWDARALTGVAASTRAAAGLAALAAVLHPLAGDTARPPGEQIAHVRQLYDALLLERYDDVLPRRADLDQLQLVAGNYGTRTDFLAALALEPPAATQDLAVGGDAEDDALIISTVHSAKGREWDAVFIPWAVDGIYPMARAAGDEDAVEEERRLLYVAMTRARDHLMVTYPLNAYGSRMGADYSIGQLSRFLDEGVRRTMQRVAVGGAADAGPAPLPPRAPIDLRALLRGGG